MFGEWGSRIRWMWECRAMSWGLWWVHTIFVRSHIFLTIVFSYYNVLWCLFYSLQEVTTPLVGFLDVLESLTKKEHHQLLMLTLSLSIKEFWLAKWIVLLSFVIMTSLLTAFRGCFFSFFSSENSDILI